jgi:peptidoglycan/xylan/chitin deacetylase (PgdA/CDA1 family)
MSEWKLKAADVVSVIYGAINAKEGCDARVLMYHAVGAKVTGDTSQLYSMSPLRFLEQMRYIATGCQPVVELEACVQSGCGMAITFDDGYYDTLTQAAPVLVSHDFPFTVFVTPAFVQSGDARYLSPDTLVELANMPGVAIGAHGYSHCRLTECNEIDLESEVRGSREWLEDLLAKPVTTMSYPHGAVDERVKAAVENAGYSLAACSRFGTHKPGSDPLLISRTDIWAQDDINRFKSKLSGHWDWIGLYK